MVNEYFDKIIVDSIKYGIVAATELYLKEVK